MGDVGKRNGTRKEHLTLLPVIPLLPLGFQRTWSVAETDLTPGHAEPWRQRARERLRQRVCSGAARRAGGARFLTAGSCGDSFPERLPQANGKADFWQVL